MRNLLMMVLLTLPAMAYADMGDAGLDMAADMTADASQDAANDAADDLGPDATSDMGMDTQNDATDAALEFFTFSGTVVLDGAADNGAVSVSVTDTKTNRQTYTDVAGAFEFAGLPASTYQVDIGYPGFISAVDTVELSADLSRSYVLTPETTHVVQVDITFENTPPSEIVIDAARKELTLNETLSVSGGKAAWSPALVEGSWNLNLSAKGYQTRQLQVDATQDGRQYNVLMTVEAPRDFTVTSDCGCRSVQTDRAMPLGLLVFLFGAIFWRQRR